jgi:hypothetical protein
VQTVTNSALTCPFTTTSGNWDPSLTVKYNATTYPDVLKAISDDYTDATMNGFANLLGCQGTDCANEPGPSLNDIYNNYIATATNFKVYYHTGQCHAERNQDGNNEGNCDYDNANGQQMVQAGVPFSSWVNGWLGNGAWNNVR